MNKVELWPQTMKFDVDKDKWGNYTIVTTKDENGLDWDEAVKVLATLSAGER